MKKKLVLVTIGAILPFLLANCGPSAADKELIERSQSAFGVLPDHMPGAENDTPEKIALGKKLYFETALSVDNTISCNSCHNVNDNGNGTDNMPTSSGVDGKKGGRNAPTVLNAGFHIAQFWDGRAPSLKEQAKGPILNPIEMAMPDEKSVIEKLRAIEGYEAEFKAAFPADENALTYDNLAEAIAAFERTLITGNKLDSFINGKAGALSKEEKEGLTLFLDSGCNACHSGPAIGGQTYQKLGAVNPYDTKDTGRYAITKNESDKFVFKVPSLRNISKTNPYFHDGMVETLEDAVKKMGYHQLGLEFSDEQINSIVTFLKAL